MDNNDELISLLKDLESDRVERKESASDHRSLRKIICAFANDLPNHGKPGVIFAGVNDKGKICGIQVTDKLLTQIAQIGKDGSITPFPTLTVQKQKYETKDIVVISVAPSDYPPVRYDGRVWVRVGPTTQKATEQEEKRLTEKRRSGNLPYDIHPIREATLDDLNIEIFNDEYLPHAVDRDILKQNKRSREDQLASLRFTIPTHPYTPTVVGMLTIGLTSRDYIPCAYIQFLRIEGQNLTDPIKDQKEIDGPLPDVLRRLEEILKINISISTDITSSIKDIQHPDYPLVTLQQLTRNAILHRSYEGTHAPIRVTWFSDRIEIQNPGGPYGQVQKANFGQPGITDYRNPNLAEVLKNLGYVQRFGIGIQIARDELRKNGNPELEYKIEDNFVLAIIRKQ